jgi:hypothetical protein
MPQDFRISRDEAKEILRQIEHIRIELDGLERWVVEMIIGKETSGE